MDYDFIRYERRGAAAWIIFNRPEKLNPMSPLWAAEISRALADASADPETRCVVITGSGRAFCAGGDLEEARGFDDPAELLQQFTRPLAGALRDLKQCPKPVIAAVNGLCLAGGLEMLLCCDIVIASENAEIGDQHSIYGLLPAIGGARNLARNVGVMKAKEIMLTGRRYKAEELREAGLVNEVVPAEELEARVTALVGLLAQRSPSGLAAMKRMVDRSLELTWEEAVESDFAINMEYLEQPDAREGLLAFRERRSPKFPPLPKEVQ